MTAALGRMEEFQLHFRGALNNGVSEEAFVQMSTARDRTLAMPNLILPSIQVNIRAGRMPEPEDNGVRYLKIPLDAL